METKVGEITHYYTNIGVGVLELSDTLKIGDKIHIQGATTDFTQEVGSMQANKEPVKEASAGDAVGLKVENRVREGDLVYKVENE
ncbi:MAG: EF-Tu/IF-2/RF-3 family GTPase [Patescibacteria group bacterium]|nr:EF-Tu/IF-2/RF-3 family GTPase [Patescibacteria group bacterium]